MWYTADESGMTFSNAAPGAKTPVVNLEDFTMGLLLKINGPKLMRRNIISSEYKLSQGSKFRTFGFGWMPAGTEISGTLASLKAPSISATTGPKELTE